MASRKIYRFYEPRATLAKGGARPQSRSCSRIEAAINGRSAIGAPTVRQGQDAVRFWPKLEGAFLNKAAQPDQREEGTLAKRSRYSAVALGLRDAP